MDDQIGCPWRDRCGVRGGSVELFRDGAQPSFELLRGARVSSWEGAYHPRPARGDDESNPGDEKHRRDYDRQALRRDQASNGVGAVSFLNGEA